MTLGLKIVEHPLLSEMRFQTIKLRDSVPVSDKCRSEMNAWLLAMFGTYEPAFVVQANNTMFVSPKQMASIRNLATSGKDAGAKA